MLRNFNLTSMAKKLMVLTLSLSFHPTKIKKNKKKKGKRDQKEKLS